MVYLPDTSCRVSTGTVIAIFSGSPVVSTGAVMATFARGRLAPEM